MAEFLESESTVESIVCPYCYDSRSLPWAKENGFRAVKCSGCGLVYVNPRPSLCLINKAVRTGVHDGVDRGRTAIARRVGSKVSLYKKIIADMFADVFQEPRKISWLDVGAGYGEVVEAVSALAAPGSKIDGLEPMEPKAVHARKRGLAIFKGFLSAIDNQYDYVSVINVFSHIPNFLEFLNELKSVLTIDGEILIETGNIGDLKNRHQIPTELDLPDHLVFAGEKHLRGYLAEAGFSIIRVKRLRKDGLNNFVKNIVKKLIGRQVVLGIPYTSEYRSIIVRAKLISDRRRKSSISK